jgi:hypothetical protein
MFAFFNCCVLGQIVLQALSKGILWPSQVVDADCAVRMQERQIAEYRPLGCDGGVIGLDSFLRGLDFWVRIRDGTKRHHVRCLRAELPGGRGVYLCKGLEAIAMQPCLEGKVPSITL